MHGPEGSRHYGRRCPNTVLARRAADGDRARVYTGVIRSGCPWQASDKIFKTQAHLSAWAMMTDVILGWTSESTARSV